MNDISPPVAVNRDVQLERTMSGTSPVMQPLASPSVAQFMGAMATAQGQFRTPKRTKPVTVKLSNGGSYKFMYAPLEEIIDAVKDALSANGLARQQYLVYRSEAPWIRTIIWHASGEWIASDYPVHPSKEGPQGFASGVTYARRYGLSLALGLAPEDDDDANLAEGNVTVPLVAANRDAKPWPQPAGMVKPRVNPLPKAPEPVVYDPETGEIEGPHAIPVPLAGDKPNWVEWGRNVIAHLKAAADYADAKEWVVQCTPSIREAKEAAPPIHARVMKAIEETRSRFAQNEKPDFMPVEIPNDGVPF